MSEVLVLKNDIHSMYACRTCYLSFSKINFISHIERTDTAVSPHVCVSGMSTSGTVGMHTRLTPSCPGAELNKVVSVTNGEEEIRGFRHSGSRDRCDQMSTLYFGLWPQ